MAIGLIAKGGHDFEDPLEDLLQELVGKVFDWGGGI